jgi:hypothetical protein
MYVVDGRIVILQQATFAILPVDKDCVELFLFLQFLSSSEPVLCNL